MKNVKKIMLTVMALVLICVGWFTEILFYYYRFNGDGLGVKVSLVMGIGLTLLLTSFFINTDLRKIIGSIILLTLSVFCTVTGQNYFYTKKQQDNNKITATEENI